MLHPTVNGGGYGVLSGLISQVWTLAFLRVMTRLEERFHLHHDRRRQYNKVVDPAPSPQPPLAPPQICGRPPCWTQRRLPELLTLYITAVITSTSTCWDPGWVSSASSGSAKNPSSVWSAMGFSLNPTSTLSKWTSWRGVESSLDFLVWALPVVRARHVWFLLEDLPEVELAQQARPVPVHGRRQDCAGRNVKHGWDLQACYTTCWECPVRLSPTQRPTQAL